ncbi:MAG: DNA translocase FtsK [Planctomycetota bacterium]
MADAAHPDESKPRFARDTFSLGLLALTLLLTLSLVTYRAADPVPAPGWPLAEVYRPDPLVYPPGGQITNACGRLGALLADCLLSNLGISVVVLIAGLGGVTTALLFRGKVNAPVLRSLGGTILLVSVAGAGGLVRTPIDGLPVYGNGGRLGGMLSYWLLDHFAPAGAWILVITATCVGLLLVSDYALLIAGKKVVAGGKMVSVAGARRAAAHMPSVRRRRQPFTDLEQPIVLEGEDEASQADDLAREAMLRRTDGEASAIRVKTPRKSRSAALAATTAGVGAAVGAAASLLGGGSKHSEGDQAAAEEFEEDFDGDGSWEDDDAVAEADNADVEDSDVDDEDDSDSEYRELATEGETLELRRDTSHETPEPPHELRIKVPGQTGKKSPGNDEDSLLDQMIENAPSGDDYHLPHIELLTESDDICYDDQLDEVRRKARVLEATFKNFGFNIRVVEIETGPVIAQYEIELEAGLRLSKITGLADDVAIALRVPSVRIVAPIPGKNTVGIEVPNETRQVVRLRDVIEESGGKANKMNIPVFLGQDVSGNPLVVDLAKMPHLLIAGRTGTGKSVCLNAIICSILMSCRPDEVRMLMIDPKMVELSGYGRLPHLMHPVITDMKKAEAILAWAVDKMEERYSLLAKVGVRHINSYNDLGREEIMRRLEVDPEDGADGFPDRLPFIVIVADEMADLMMTAGKDVEQHIIRLAQKSRAVGIHLILATQKPTVDVITGLIKSNLPARLSFQVASKTDSRVVLDENGADKLLGNGDMLFLWPGTSTLIRGQGTYLSDDEIDSVCGHCSTTEQSFVGELMNLKVAEEEGEGTGTTMEQIKKRDELYDSAIEVVIREGRGSCSLLQRCLGIGYGRAAKLIDYMAEDGVVGQYNGSKAREVILTMAQWQEMQGLEVDAESESGGDDWESDDSTGGNDSVGGDGDDEEDYSPPFEVSEAADPSDDEYEDYE